MGKLTLVLLKSAVSVLVGQENTVPNSKQVSDEFPVAVTFIDSFLL